jgi:hypothetical protein
MIQNRGRTAATLILEKGEVLTFRLPGRWIRIACVAGRLWATMDRSPTDHLLAPGEARTFGGRGTVVIQALRTATARIEEFGGRLGDAPINLRSCPSTPMSTTAKYRLAPAARSPSARRLWRRNEVIA